MNKLEATDLFSLEEYHKVREEFRARVLAHKRQRQMAVGPNLTLLFEDRLTMHYQVQEMLRIERIFETEAIEEELAAYNPLIPDGGNFKATLMIEFPDADERRQALHDLVGIEETVFVQAAGFETVFAHADEDLKRTSDGKTSAVHFLRFELSDAMRRALLENAGLTVGVRHPRYQYSVEADAALRTALIADLS